MENDGKLPPTLDELMEGAEPTLQDDGKGSKGSKHNEGDDKDKLKINPPKVAKKEKLEDEEEEQKVEKVEKTPKGKKKEEKNGEEEEQEEEDTKKGKKNEEEEEEEPNDDPIAFWEDVEKITGENIEVDFGDVNPETPEGAVIYARAFRDKGISDFEETIRTKFPREFKALQLASEGLDLSSLYKDLPEVDYSKVTLDEKDISQNKKYYIESLKLRNVNDDDIKELVQLAEEKGRLAERGRSGLKELQDHQNKILSTKDAEANQQLVQNQKMISGIVKAVNETVNKGKIGDFTIPEKDRPELIKRVLANIRLDNGRFIMMEELTAENLEQKLQAEYFTYKKGNLAGLVERRAKTEAVRKLRRTVEEGDKKPKGTGGSGKTHSPSLQDLTED